MLPPRWDCCLVLLCAGLATGCNSGSESLVCPAVDTFHADPSQIPPGESTTTVMVVASDPEASSDSATGRPISTLLSSSDGVFEDAAAKQTTFTCDPYAEGPVEICVEAEFADEQGSSVSEDDVLATFAGTGGAAAAQAYLRGPNVYLQDPDVCTTRKCITVTCAQNICPVIERLESVPGTTEGELGTSTIFVRVSDPDDRPEALEVTLTAEAGTFDDPHSTASRYRCDLARTGEPLEICVHASDGDEKCDQIECIEVECNVCPNLNILNAIPSAIPDPNKIKIEWRAIDPDYGPQPLAAQLTATSGSFDDPTAMDSVFTCDTPGQAEVCVEVSDSVCVKSTCIVVLCPDV